jgi:photosystem II stability/assembly factor-like uncharacterized protein
VYASTGYNFVCRCPGVFKSADAGATWVTADAGLSALRVEVLAVDPLRPSNVYAGTDKGIYKSTNGGRPWDRVTSRRYGSDTEALVIDPRKSTIVYAGTLYGALLKSTNGGRSWRAMKTGGRIKDVSVLVVDPPSTRWECWETAVSDSCSA